MSETINRQCPVCGKTYAASVIRLKFGRQTTCSRVCSYELRAAPKRNAVAATCATCAKSIESAPSSAARRKHGAAFCSRECHYAGRATGATRRVVVDAYELSDATRAGHSVRAAVAYARGNGPPIPAAEGDVRTLLETQGVEFVHQCVFETERGACCVDFYIPALRLVIEVDGGHHSKPRHVARDMDRDRWFARAGIRTARVPNGATADDVSRALAG
jgi:endogenous inhibitor of DNA gyrase (YacG/DUF329 family)